jgi:molybdopterin synthase catalytic subunit/molybdopterin synthase sulfur carrier subunit
MLFAKFKEIANVGNFDLDLPVGADVSEAIDKICLQYPSLNLKKAKFLISVNYDYANHSKFLQEGDEIALIPPVSGG